MRPPLLVYPSFHWLQNTYRVLIQAQHGANKSPVSFGSFHFLACVFIQVSPRQFADYMFLKVPFVFFNFDEPRIYFMVDYITIMLLSAFAGYYLLKVLRSKHKNSNWKESALWWKVMSCFKSQHKKFMHCPVCKNKTSMQHGTYRLPITGPKGCPPRESGCEHHEMSTQIQCLLRITDRQSRFGDRTHRSGFSFVPKLPPSFTPCSCLYLVI